MTEHFLFILDSNYISNKTNKYICKENSNCIIYIPFNISKKNNISKEKIRISID